MSRQLTTAALTVFLLAAAAVAAYRPPNSLASQWARTGPAHPTQDTVAFTLTLRWDPSGERHLDLATSSSSSDDPLTPEAQAAMAAAHQAAPGHASINAAMAAWRNLVRTTDDDVAAVAAALKAHGISPAAHCTQRFDAFDCAGVPVAAAQRFLRPARPFARFRSSALPAYRRRKDFVLTPTQPDDFSQLFAALPQIVAVSGCSLFDVEVLRKARDTRRDPSRALFGDSDSSATSLLGGGGPSLTWPEPGNGAPVILNLNAQGKTEAGAILGLNCANGKPAEYSPFLKQLMCPNSTLPKSITFDIASPTKKWRQSFPPSQCNDPPVAKGKVICQFLLTGFDAWGGPYDVNASTTFLNNVTSPVARLMNFNATHFESGAVRSNIGRYFQEQQASPQDLLTMYGVPASAQPSAGAWATSNVTQGVIELAGIASGAFTLSDLELYMFLHGVANFNKSMVAIVGPDEDEAGGEATLDIELIMGVAQGTRSVFYSQVAGESLNGWIVKWLQKLIWQTHEEFAFRPPAVWSCSYGGPDQYDRTHSAVAERYYKFLSASGVTFTTASGDSGTWGGQVSYPATSVHNVAVGATANRGPASAPKPVTCTAHDLDLITSTGGFSPTFNTTPAYQKAFIPAGSPTGRAVPDVAALGSYLNFVQKLQSQPVWGTSASSPITAGLFTLANHARAKVGLPTIAFANRFVYAAKADVFTDITIGNNCYGEAQGVSMAYVSWPKPWCYDAAKGWDAATGRGTIVYPKFAAHALNWTNPASPAPLPSPLPVPTPSPTKASK